MKGAQGWQMLADFFEGLHVHLLDIDIAIIYDINDIAWAWS